MRVAVLNAGSATVKGAVVQVDASGPTAHARISRASIPESDPKQTFGDLLEELLATGAVDAVGHRIVHGGREFRSTVRLEPSMEPLLEALGHLAPLHNPVALAGIRAARERLPGCPQVGVFDTAFHADRRPESFRYPLPWDLCEELGLVRYGFHGIAHTALSGALAEARAMDASDVTAVTLQLGAGCSGCAIDRGRSVETSMGFSPLGGLPMATRCGDLDPGVVLELLRRGRSVEELEDLLTHGSGLYGLSGTADMREVLRAEAQGDERAGVAVALFVRSIVGLTGAYLTLLRGEGAIVFGGGIGAGSSEIRERVARGLSAWDVALDPERNTAMQWGRISQEGTRPVYVFETDEERLIAREAYALLRGGGAQ